MKSLSDREKLSLLNSQISYARMHSSFYRYLPSKPLTSIQELSYLPTISSQDIILSGAEMLCCSPSQVQRMVTVRTSGTTGMPKRIAFSAGDLENTVDFFHHGMEELCLPYHRVGIFMPGSNPDGLCDLLSRGIIRFGGTPVPFGLISDYQAAALFFKENALEVVVGLPTQMRTLSLLYPELHPKRVLLSADYISPSVTQTIERVWQCEVYAHYGLTESGLGCAVELPARRGMEIRSDILLECDADGEILLTTLRREGMPLIRYRTGDLGEMLPNGNLKVVYGRKAVLKEMVNINHLDDILLSQDGILRFRAEKSIDGYNIYVVGDQSLAETMFHKAFPDVPVRVIPDHREERYENSFTKRRMTQTI